MRNHYLFFNNCEYQQPDGITLTMFVAFILQGNKNKVAISTMVKTGTIIVPL